MKYSITHILFSLALILSAQVSWAQSEGKTNAVRLESQVDSALVQILKLEPEEFVTKQKGVSGKTNYGFQLEAFEKVFPSMVYTKLQVVNTRNSGKNALKKTLATKHIDYASLVPVLVAAMQEQQALILKQQQQIEALQKRISIE